MKNLIIILTLLILGNSFLLSIGNREKEIPLKSIDEQILKLENTFVNFDKWEKEYGNWKNGNGILEKIETYSILNNSNNILLVFYTRTGENMMSIIDLNKLDSLQPLFYKKDEYDHFGKEGDLEYVINNSMYPEINILDLNPINGVYHLKDSYNYNKMDFLYSYLNDNLPDKELPIFRSNQLLTPYHIYEDKIQFLFHLRCDHYLDILTKNSCNHLGFSDFYEIGIEHLPNVQNKMVNILDKNHSGGWDWEEYHQGVKNIMISSYYESSLNDFKKIFLIE